MKKDFVIGVVALIVVIMCGVLYYNFSVLGDRPAATEVFAPEPSDSLLEETIHMLLVYVTGEVLYPGVYELNENSRVQDAIIAAGGETENADLSIINLARFVSDGEHIIVPAFGDDPPPTSGHSAGGRININIATQSELMTLPNIGEVTAAAIISHREQNGRFTEIEQIKNVPRIGERTFAAIENLITVR